MAHISDMVRMLAPLRVLPFRLEDLALKLRKVKLLTVKHPWYAATGIVTGSVLLSPLWHKLWLRNCTFTTDLSGKIVVITGGDEGIGKATAMELARRNAQVIMGCKNEALASQVVKEIKAATGNSKIHYRPLDLCSFQSTENFIDDLYEMVSEVNVLINCADDFYTGKTRKITKDGCERMMQSNYLGHFLLTTSLMDLLDVEGHAKTSRIINVTSMGHQLASLDLEDLSSLYSYSPLGAYLKSKLALVLFTTELPSKNLLLQKDITANVVNPGFVKTNIETTFLQGLIMKMLYFFYGKTPLQGAQTILHVALCPNLEKVSGGYFRNCKRRELPRKVDDKELAEKLYSLSEDIIDREI